MELTPQERQRIYEEEKSRLEDQERLKREKAETERAAIQERNKVITKTCQGIILGVFVCFVLLGIAWVAVDASNKAQVDRIGAQVDADMKAEAARNAALRKAGHKMYYPPPKKKESSQAADSTPAPYRITAARLQAAYSGNQIACDKALKGQLLAVSGKVQSVGKDILGTPYVALDTDAFQPVQCMFDESDADSIANVWPGQRVVITGTCDGAFAAWVLIKNCKLERLAARSHGRHRKRRR